MKKRILLVFIGLALSYCCGRLLLYVFEKNADSIIYEGIFPGGNLYSPGKKLTEVYAALDTETKSEMESETEINIPMTEAVAELETVTESEKYALAVTNSVYTIDELTNFSFAKENFYVISSNTELTEEMLDLDKLVTTDLRLAKDESNPQILIFHTHGQEKFADSDKNNKSIVDVGEYLAKQLKEKYGYNVLHITESFDYVNGKLDRSMAYTYANQRLEEILEENPTIEVVIDLHRDGVGENTHLVTEINEKKTAQIMLFNGISYTKAQGDLKDHFNPYRLENLAMTYQMNLLAEESYPDFVRCIYVDAYRYCLHHRARSLLIEAGAQTNTYEEVCNAMEPLADLINMELSVH